MAEITASMVKELREKTGAGMMEAKKALVESKGDMEAASDWLRKKGLATAEKKSSRTAAEGLVAFAISGTKGALVEVNAETDFVGKNDEFRAYVSKVAEVALKTGANDVEKLAAAALDGKTVQDGLTALIAKIGENMKLRRCATLEVKQGVVIGYMHNALEPGLGKIGVLVALESSGQTDKLNEIGKQIAMHVAAAFPKFLDSSSVDASALEKEKNFLRDQARQSGKPPEIIEKMLEGRIRKFYEEVCLMDQVSVIDGENRISKVVENAAKDAGAPVKLAGFLRFQLGEGIEKEEKDFASEVAAVVNG
ncbi:MAG: elongation factor Ts [Proteobacteria bacterium]|nr:elongation factor Ts [Pseudomonadota bacterium]